MRIIKHWHPTVNLEKGRWKIVQDIISAAAVFSLHLLCGVIGR